MHIMCGAYDYDGDAVMRTTLADLGGGARKNNGARYCAVSFLLSRSLSLLFLFFFWGFGEDDEGWVWDVGLAGCLAGVETMVLEFF